jgi:hypothetical protein
MRETKAPGLVSVHVDMNMKRKLVRPEFKQFQRLPQWPVALGVNNEKRSLADTSIQKVGIIPLLVSEYKFGTRSLAE